MGGPHAPLTGADPGAADMTDADDDSIASSIQKLIEQGQAASANATSRGDLLLVAGLPHQTHPPRGRSPHRKGQKVPRRDRDPGRDAVRQGSRRFREGEHDAARLLISKGPRAPAEPSRCQPPQRGTGSRKGCKSKPPPTAGPPRPNEGSLIPAADPGFPSSMTTSLASKMGGGRVRRRDVDDDLFGERR